MHCTDCASPITRAKAGADQCPACQESRLRRLPIGEPKPCWFRDRMFRPCSVVAASGLPDGYRVLEDDGSPD